jgi:hypothetical protein
MRRQQLDSGSGDPAGEAACQDQRTRSDEFVVLVGCQAQSGWPNAFEGPKCGRASSPRLRQRFASWPW